MKLLKRKNFQALIYAIFISLPMLSILPSTIYFAFNHEAANYTHDEVIETYEYETNEVNSVDDLIVGNIYKGTIDSANYYYSQTYIEVNAFFFNGDYQILCDNIGDIYKMQITQYNNNNSFRFTFYNPSFTEVIYLPIGLITDYPTLEFYFVYKNTTSMTQYVNISASDYLGEKNVEVIESEMNPLSAFDNAIGKFVSDNDFGNLDFFTFFSSLFLTSTSMNNLYIHFINWYMNYALYVSLAYLLFGVLLYFVNFFRKLVENSEDTHIGGF